MSTATIERPTLNGLPFMDGFNPTNVKVLLEKSPSSLVIAHEDVWQNAKTFNICQVYIPRGSEYWAPGKGLMIPLTEKAKFLEGLRAL